MTKEEIAFTQSVYMINTSREGNSKRDIKLQWNHKASELVSVLYKDSVPQRFMERNQTL